MLLLILIACNAVPAGSAAQADPWAAPLRGSWVRTGPAATGDVVLASHDSGVEIVVGAAENLNVRQAAAFLAGDIETISGYRPPIVSTPTTGRTSIRLATVGNGPLPAAIDAAALRGQWESYRVVTAPRTVWLVGSNPRGTAFAAYTLSERLGVDPLYLWSSRAYVSRRGHRRSGTAGSSTTTRISYPVRSTLAVIHSRPGTCRWPGTAASSKRRCGCG